MVNNGTEYKIGSIDSSNDTYADIVHLTQAQYDALENPDPDTLYSTPDNAESGEFVPENEGDVGQVLKKTNSGYGWGDVSEFEPSNAGSINQVLTKTANGYEWGTPQTSSPLDSWINNETPLSSGNSYPGQSQEASISIPDGAKLIICYLYNSSEGTDKKFQPIIIPLEYLKSNSVSIRLMYYNDSYTRMRYDSNTGTLKRYPYNYYGLDYYFY